MRLYSYVVKTDSGFAPNPSDNYCTLACCKPKIRKKAEIDDWVIGTGSKRNVGVNSLIYAMKITEKVTFEQYSYDKRFKNRIDNIYYVENEILKQKDNTYHHQDDMDYDLRGVYVLISDYFLYFGKDAKLIPEKFNEIIKSGPGHKCNFDKKLIMNFLKWLDKKFNKYGRGRHGDPFDLIKQIKVKRGKC